MLACFNPGRGTLTLSISRGEWGGDSSWGLRGWLGSKMRGVPSCLGCTAKPGEKAMTCRNRSPLPSPSESAYDAPSENPPMATRAGSAA